MKNLFYSFMVALVLVGCGGSGTQGDPVSEYANLKSTNEGYYLFPSIIVDEFGGISKSGYSWDRTGITSEELRTLIDQTAGTTVTENSICFNDSSDEYDTGCTYPNDPVGYRTIKKKASKADHEDVFIISDLGITEYDEVYYLDTTYIELSAGAIRDSNTYTVTIPEQGIYGTWNYKIFPLDVVSKPIAEQSGQVVLSASGGTSTGISFDAPTYDSTKEYWYGTASYKEEDFNYLAVISLTNYIMSYLLCPSGVSPLDHTGECRVMQATRSN